MDMIAIPDFAAGAMENWGLITYRETALLCDESSSVAARSRVAYVVAHELCACHYTQLFLKKKKKPKFVSPSGLTNGLEIWSQWSGGNNFT